MIQNNIQKYNTFRKTYPIFIFHGYQIFEFDNKLKIEYHFEIKGLITFKPYVEISIKKNIPFHVDLKKMDNLLFHIGVVESISYWKATCSPIIRIPKYRFTKEQEQFWKKLFYHGQGEFLYLNGINPLEDELFEFEYVANNKLEPVSFNVNADEYIVPIGGGKDSAVTLQTLINAPVNVIPFIMNSRGATEATIIKAGYDMEDVLEIKRIIAPELLQLNEKGFLNGHTPFSAMLAFYTVLLAALTHKKHIALSNESSANEPTIPGTKVNHQYSKSFEFENDFRNYIKNTITVDINYFSFLRPISELHIAGLLAHYEKYLSVFKSCNVGSKQDIWCGNCPKCLFTFIMLAPFVSYEKLVNIFQKDLLNDKGLLTYFNELTGLSDIKPFECVGTVDEVNIALCELIKQLKYNDLPYLLKYFIEHKNLSEIKPIQKELKDLSLEHNLNVTQFNILKNSINALF